MFESLRDSNLKVGAGTLVCCGEVVLQLFEALVPGRNALVALQQAQVKHRCRKGVLDTTSFVPTTGGCPARAVLTVFTLQAGRLCSSLHTRSKRCEQHRPACPSALTHNCTAGVHRNEVVGQLLVAVHISKKVDPGLLHLPQDVVHLNSGAKEPLQGFAQGWARQPHDW